MSRTESIDVVKIKSWVKQGLIKFEVVDGSIFCFDPKSGERAKVG